MSSLNNTPLGERLHIAFFGVRNAGKSSLLNAFTNQNLAIVSDQKGTTTDPVYKNMELLPLGPVVVIDTPGIDDVGELGSLRVAKTKQVLNKTDIAIIVAQAGKQLGSFEKEIITNAKSRNIPYIVAYNKCDLIDCVPNDDNESVYVSAKTGFGINTLKEKCALLIRQNNDNKRVVGDLLEVGDIVVLVVPIDKSAPKGRLILPQQQTIRDVIDSGATAIVCRDSELEQTLKILGKKPKLVVTDSQVFGKVDKIVPKDIPLTSFSILMARYKGDLATVAKGAAAVDKLQKGDKVLISEGCTHHRQCEDIGTVKLPGWIKNHVGCEIEFCFTSGTDFPADLSGYKLVVHCGGCMLNEKEMKYRLRCCQDANVPVTNYGTLIAHLNGILTRSIQMFKDILI